MKQRLALILLLTFGALLTGCSAAGWASPADGPAADAPAAPGARIGVEDAWARPTVPAMGGQMAGHDMPTGGATSAVYFVLVNAGGADDALVGAQVATDLAQAAEVHETAMEGGVARMRAVPRVELPAGGQVEFKPGGYHVMLLGVQRALAPGDRIQLTLQLESAGDLPVEAEVRAP